MNEHGNSTRLRFLKHGLLAAAGAAGIGAVASRGEAAGMAPAPKRGRTRLTLHGRGWHASVPGKKAGLQPDRGHSFHVHGELLERPNGKPVGEFVGSVVHVESPFAGSTLGTVAFEHHVLHLRDGAIFATGHSADGTGSFAIVGGTGAYAGATGSYVARQSVHGLGGDGTAKLTITVTIT